MLYWKEAKKMKKEKNNNNQLDIRTWWKHAEMP